MSAELICLFDSNFTLIRVNETWPRIFGIAGDVAAGRSFFEFVPEQQHHQIKTDLAILGSEVRSASYTHAIGFCSHVTSWIEWTYRILLDEQGVVVAYEAVGDLESRKVA